MVSTIRRAALALVVTCTLAACRKQEADEALTRTEANPAPALSPVAAELTVWDVGFDDAGADPGGYQMAEQPGGGWSLKTGAVGSLTWRDGDLMESGPFRVRATFRVPARTAEDGYGIFLGGRHPKDADRVFSAFLVRPDGSYRIERREGDTRRALVDWTPAPGAGAVDNTLELRVEGTTTHFLLNDTEVTSLPNERSEPYGTVGLRAGKGADVIVRSFVVESGTEGAPPPR